ncbi:hypothetical protein [Glaciibacter sp. 2TAF33]|uniref:hypothetical protein n=1 Tax=Glaciibacter sp. 2TAF33 TaxID=3233015 RepID=UPI003F8EEA4B
MAPSPDDEIRFILNARRWIDADVASRLWTRGWAVADLAVGEGEPFEWFWPPTAPVGYGGLPDWGDEAMQRRPQIFGPRQTPWIRPTRITKTGTAWTLEYGEAIAQKPAAPQAYAEDTALIADLERLEWWPMTIEEARKIQRSRLFEVTTAMAHDAHYLGLFPTEPYVGRGKAIRARQLFEHQRARGVADAGSPTARTPGDLNALARLLDAEAWASAVRTARAGGNGWGVSGPDGA